MALDFAKRSDLCLQETSNVPTAFYRLWQLVSATEGHE